MTYLYSMATRHVKLDQEKLRAAVSHIVEQCDPERLGAVKLHKVLYYSDMLHFLATGQSITGALYKKRPFGPTCDALLRMLKVMEDEGQIRIDTVDYYGYEKKQFTVLTPRETNQLSTSETALLEDMIDFVCNANTAKTISDFSHDMVWGMVENGDVMPYYNAIHLIPNQVPAEALEWARSEIAEIEDSGQKSTDAKLAHKDVRAVRKSLVELREQ